MTTRRLDRMPHCPPSGAALVATLWLACVACGPVVTADAPAAPPRRPPAPSRPWSGPAVDGVAPAPLVPRGLDATYYLVLAGERVTAHFAPAGGPGSGSYGGTLVHDDSGDVDALSAITYDAPSGALAFHRAGPLSGDWVRARVVEGIVVGRAAHGLATSPLPSSPTAFAAHVTGWSGPLYDGHLAPRVYDLLLAGGYHARFRLDRDDDTGQLAARFKVYATVDGGAAGEEAEYPATVLQWNGHALVFSVDDPRWSRVFTATVTGNRLAGTFTQTGVPGERGFSGTRAEVLGHGLLPRSVAARATWQARTRRALAHLLMAGDPPALSTLVSVIAADAPPRAATRWVPSRDDNPDNWPQAYRTTEMEVLHAIADPAGGPPLVRRIHAVVAVPTVPPPPGGFPAVLALNGHDGSARGLFDPDGELYWYGDAFARRGSVVMAIDVGHRPVGDRAGVDYEDYPTGDDPDGGNGVHPAIHSADLDSDFEEDGERAWDALRALDALRLRPDVNPARVTVAGLSMGGEIATLAGALDPNVAAVVAAGFSPDLGVLAHHDNHPCWRWAHADVREYVDVSDYHALVAPRPLLVETGKGDYTFSSWWAPFAGDKQVLARTRAAYAPDAPDNVVHYLHYDGHHFHFGDVNPAAATESGVRVPLRVEPDPAAPPDAPGVLAWQTDAATRSAAPTLFVALARFFGSL